ncbi:MAG TPA: hypothetical protein VGQ91_18740 [Ideonella sp.]|jgi:hypothetical protein|nr:hypothetical protein [Ideonella sp.]
MKKILFGLSLVASAAFAPAAQAAYPVCVDFSAAGYCDAMQYDAKNAATWIRYDCASNGAQTKASYPKGKTMCDGALGCNPSAAYGWEWLKWKFNYTNSTGTLTGKQGGVKYTLQQDMPVSIYAGACTALEGKSGVSSLAR